MPARLRVGIDATPLLGPRSGVGRYVEGLLQGLRDLPDSGVEPVLTTFSMRGAVPPETDQLRAILAPRRLPARLLQPAWTHAEFPRVEFLTGPIGVFHGTNFVQPPSRAGGVLSIHDLAFLHHADTVTPTVLRYRHLVPRSVARSELIVCFTEAIRQEICEAYAIPLAKVRVIPHGVDAAWGSADAPTDAQLTRWGLPSRYLLAVGTLEPRKNLGLLITAHARARAAAPEAVPPLVLVGATGWGDRFGNAEPNPADVVFAGRVADGQLQAMVAGAQAVCMASRYEGFGLPVLEALAAGTPVLASDIPAHREVGADAVTYLAPDVEAWTAALATGRYSALGDVQQRRRRASAFTWAASAAQHVATYQDAAG